MLTEIMESTFIDTNWISAVGTLVQAIAAVAAFYVAKAAKNISEKQKDIADQQREIAERQTEILQVQTNLALYDRRYNIYHSLMTLVGTALREGALTSDDLIAFWQSSKEGGFLLDDELNSYIQEVQRKANSYVALCRNEPTISGPELEAWLIKNDTALTYFHDVFDETPIRFEKYLGFKQINLKQ